MQISLKVTRMLIAGYYRTDQSGQIVEDDISAVSIAPSHFRQVLARTKTTALPRARV